MAHKFDKPGGIAAGNNPQMFHALRVVTGTVSSDVAPFDVAHYAIEGDDNTAVNCTGYETVFVRAVFTGTGSVKVTPRVLDAEDALWFRLAGSDGTVIETADIAADADKLFELRVGNRAAVLFQLTISGSVSDLTLYGIPGIRAVR
jgi:hypothetical protein